MCKGGNGICIKYNCAHPTNKKHWDKRSLEEVEQDCKGCDYWRPSQRCGTPRAGGDSWGKFDKPTRGRAQGRLPW